jgi:hypothetical protein
MFIEDSPAASRLIRQARSIAPNSGGRVKITPMKGWLIPT